ncbi:MAG: prenyltransferase [Deltaproteobacteria bacterium]|nr:prenyltransferase [Deltaproteobacteria bacterium]
MSLKEILLRHIRVKTLVVSFHTVTNTYLISGGTPVQLLIALVLAVLLQTSANLYNSLQNFENSKSLMMLFVLTLGSSFLIGSYLAVQKPILWIFGVPAIVFVLGYSKKFSFMDFRISEHPLADLIILLSFGPIATFGCYAYFSGTDIPSLVMLAPLNAVFAHNLLWIHRIKDIEKDLSLGKKTFSVRLGEHKSIFVFAVENLIMLCLFASHFGLVTSSFAIASTLATLIFLTQRKFNTVFHFWITSLTVHPLWLCLAWNILNLK